MNIDIYEQLKAVAKSRKCTYYSDIAPLANLDMKNVKDRKEIADILGEISIFENEHQRPLLSAIVVLKGSKKPGSGFFGLAESLNLFDGQDRNRFSRDERDRVWAHWG